MIKKFVLLYISLLSLPMVGQQESMYTQFMYNKLSLNPAYAGNDETGSVTALFRDQWNGFPGAPNTQILSLNLPKYQEDMGFGVNLKRNSIGVTNSIKLSGAYAYKIPLGGGKLSMGINTSISNFTIDFTDDRIFATDGIANDPSIPNQKQGVNLFNLGTGLYYNQENLFFGVSVPGMLRNKFDFDSNDRISKKVRHLFVMGGGSFKVNDHDFLNVQSMFKFAENAPIDLDVGVSYTMEDKYTGGINYRFGGGKNDYGESIDVLFSFRISENFMLGLSQDFTISKIRSVDNGSIELLGYYTFKKKGDGSASPTNPRFF